MKYVGNLVYKVIVSPRAKEHLRSVAYYIRYVLKNPIAAESVIRDAEKTKDKLTYLAKSLKLCDEPELAIQGYRVILFQKHDYVMLYRVDGDTVYVDGICHELQNYRNLFK